MLNLMSSTAQQTHSHWVKRDSVDALVLRGQSAAMPSRRSVTTRADSFGARLKTKREENGLNQEQLAEKIGISKAQISYYESNKDRPSYDKLILITKVLDCSSDHLLTGAEGVAGKVIDPDAYKLLLRLDALPEALREYVMGALHIAERTKSRVPARFITPPTQENWQQFHEYLQTLADSLPKPNDDSRS